MVLGALQEHESVMRAIGSDVGKVREATAALLGLLAAEFESKPEELAAITTELKLVERRVNYQKEKLQFSEPT